MIKIDIKIGDTILTGKWKNKKIIVKNIGTDIYGSPTVNGKSILKIRIPKLYQKENTMKNIKLKNLLEDKLEQYKGEYLWWHQKSKIKKLLNKYQDIPVYNPSGTVVTRINRKNYDAAMRSYEKQAKELN